MADLGWHWRKTGLSPGRAESHFCKTVKTLSARAAWHFQIAFHHPLL
jgi:hypothetical protein